MMPAVSETVEVIHHVSFHPSVAALRPIVRFGLVLPSYTATPLTRLSFTMNQYSVYLPVTLYAE